MPLGGAEILPDSLVLLVNIASINTFCPECSILVIIGRMSSLTNIIWENRLHFLRIF